MSQLSTEPPPLARRSSTHRSTARRSSARRSTARTAVRWMVSFVGFPLGGLIAVTLGGPVDSPLTAIIGGLLTGTVLGAAQALALRGYRGDLLTWVAATAGGLAVGLTVGTSVVDFRTGIGDLVLQGAICGVTVGTTQALALVRRTGPVAFLWPAYMAAAWSIGWAVTTAVGVQVEEQFTVFGASGAVVVTALTAVLPVLLDARMRTRGMS